jgi:hypothetical protein
VPRAFCAQRFWVPTTSLEQPQFETGAGQAAWRAYRGQRELCVAASPTRGHGQKINESIDLRASVAKFLIKFDLGQI